MIMMILINKFKNKTNLLLLIWESIKRCTKAEPLLCPTRVIFVWSPPNCAILVQKKTKKLIIKKKKQESNLIKKI